MRIFIGYKLLLCHGTRAVVDLCAIGSGPSVSYYCVLDGMPGSHAVWNWAFACRSNLSRLYPARLILLQHAQWRSS